MWDLKYVAAHRHTCQVLTSIEASNFIFIQENIFLKRGILLIGLTSAAGTNVNININSYKTIFFQGETNVDMAHRVILVIDISPPDVLSLR